MQNQAQIDVALHPKQGVALNTTATEVLYGGAAGGGKSHLMRIIAIIWCCAIPGLQVYLFRRIREDLIKNHVEGPKGFRNLLAPWVLAKFVVIVDDEIRFWNGSKIYLCHCKDEKHRFKYQGAEIHVLLIDELTHFTEKIYRYLRGRVRAVGLKLPDEYKDCFPRILCGSNPGNIGHAFVKKAFIDNALPYEIRQMPDAEGGMRRQYIPARLDDNPSMAKDDPTYRARLRGLGSDALVRAMEDGDWDVIEGAFFNEFYSKLHVLQPFSIPLHWTRFRSFDWGSAKPFSVGWWAIVEDDYQIADGRTLPRGAIVRYREWYGRKEGDDNADVGLKLTAEEVGAGIAERSKEEPSPSYGVGDPAAWTADGGPSIMENLIKAERTWLALNAQHLSATPWRKADNTRVAKKGAIGGWDQMRNRLKGNEEDVPMIYCFSTCLDSIRTIPVLQHDENRPEDLDTHSEDHAADDWRYACMSRPYVRPIKKEDQFDQQQFLRPPTFNEMLERQRQRRLNDE